ncbi:hypothetical protein J2S77_000168 [Alkalibacillus salilacus]|uniref:Uncharacterized protein n=1 Tax=Alkalibacillus salilacus TaxID=284582 RepID=A0ABT9VB76_9BACI|nr:hypothetical protein [Alkalibacillus salilacus]
MGEPTTPIRANKIYVKDLVKSYKEQGLNDSLPIKVRQTF